MTQQQYEATHKEVIAEAQRLNISDQTVKEAISFMSDFLPTISEYSGSTRLAIFGLACYNAGKNSR